MSGEQTDRTSLVIGTRGSTLALWQAEWVQARLRESAPGLSVTLRRIKTSGDKILDVPLAKLGGKGLFVKEIEEALLRREIDVAVHSMKDVPTALPEGLALLCVPKREDPRDALLSRAGTAFRDLPSGAKVGTSSLRRQAQLLHLRRDVTITMLRGNLDTRLRKLKEGEFDAIVLAAAGLRRLGWTEAVTEYLSPDTCVPAIGQGALAIEGRHDDQLVRRLLAPLEDAPTRVAVTAERALLERLEGGCQVPIAAHALLQGETITVDALVASVDGRSIIRERLTGKATEAQEIGRRLAERLLAGGGRAILNEIYGRA
ncbi:MAG: hydroxymethylbilane synthase [Nitrospira sp.]|nr:MAG: hydroxymethylbilane synthase [Nitrospira sp.]